MLKDLMVHLDGTPEDEVRIEHAESIALRYEAHLTGLYTNALPEYAYALAIQPGFAPVVPVEVEERVRRDGDIAFARLTEDATRIRVPNEIRRIDAPFSQLPNLCASEARWADLFVATAPYGRQSVWDSLVEAALFESGHGVFLIPAGCKTKDAIRHILVAWRDTRESARAVGESLPFLEASETTRIVTVDPPQKSDQDLQSIDLAAHLNRHGAKIDLLSVETGDGTVAQTLLDEAHRMAADLIVMGAYGHSRFREWILGGTTREMIGRSDVPILIAH
ncbi:MAG: universal stress protein [Methylobacteriaceae bacterium]|nr:universal stress protein [Methylobacteriaceae bacterium]MBV9704105.1 universal stress protein [Methylobacteriaceae bacterium]